MTRPKRGIFIAAPSSSDAASEHRAEGGTYSDDEAAEVCDVQIYLPTENAERLKLLRQLIDGLIDPPSSGVITLKRQMVIIYGVSRWRTVAPEPSDQTPESKP